MIEVWDGVCGMGKTHSIKKEIIRITQNKSQFNLEDNKVIYVTPYREECYLFAGIKYRAVTDSENKKSQKNNKKTPTYSPILLGNELVYEKLNDGINFRFDTTAKKIKKGNKDITSGEIFEDLLDQNKNIVTTHSAFFRLSKSILKKAASQNYVVIIDEAPDIIQTEKFKNPIDFSDIEYLVGQGVLSLSNQGVYGWNKKFQGSLSLYKELKELLNRGGCFLRENNNKTACIRLIPPYFFTSFEKIYVLTYLFKKSILEGYFNKYEVQYEYKNKTVSEFLVNPRIQQYQYLINLYRGESKYRGTIFGTHQKALRNFSRNMYEEFLDDLSYDEINGVYSLKEDEKRDKKDRRLKYSQTKLYQLSNTTESFFGEKIKANERVKTEFKNMRVGDISVFELYKISKPYLLNEDYIDGNDLHKGLTKEIETFFINSGIFVDEFNKDKVWSDLLTAIKICIDFFNDFRDEESKTVRMWSTFKKFEHLITNDHSPRLKSSKHLVFNIKATNLYKDKASLAFLVNVYPNPSLGHFLKEQGIPFDENQYATSTLIQWIFRSRLRDGKKINLFIASGRMRLLFKEWLMDYEKQINEKIDEVEKGLQESMM
jgi:hypothetical protein